jgi:hypothetical protein
MKMKTSELQGAALDWAVAKCEGDEFVILDGKVFIPDCDGVDDPYHYRPSVSYNDGGPIIEREGMALNMEDTHEWRAAMWWDDEDSKGDILMVGPTPLIAAMRCYVASQLGDEVDIPDFSI